MRRPPPGCDPESIVLTFPVPPEQAGLRLDRFIQLRIPRLSRTRAKSIVKACAYRADGTRRRPSSRVRAGETVLIVRPPMNEPPTPQSYGVLFEDHDVLTVLKPAGLPMHPTATYHRNTLTHLLWRDYGDDGPQFAHRLDRETSGVVVCGKHRDAEVELKRCFERRKVHKSYLAIVRGRPAQDRGHIDLPLGQPPTGPHVLMAVRADGSKAVTRYEVIDERQGASLVRLHPETGRQHQLRVHMAAVGHPIIGDKLYGPENEQPFLEMIEGPTHDLLVRLVHPRHALHAERLEIAHPTSGVIMEFSAPLPWDLRALWKNVGQALGGDPIMGWEEILHPRWDGQILRRDEPSPPLEDTQEA